MTEAATMDLPLKGVRVVEFCQMVMGPSCGMILADLGADVIKITATGGVLSQQGRGLGGAALVGRAAGA